MTVFTFFNGFNLADLHTSAAGLSPPGGVNKFPACKGPGMLWSFLWRSARAHLGALKSCLISTRFPISIFSCRTFLSCCSSLQQAFLCCWVPRDFINVSIALGLVSFLTMYDEELSSLSQHCPYFQMLQARYMLEIFEVLVDPFLVPGHASLIGRSVSSKRSHTYFSPRLSTWVELSRVSCQEWQGISPCWLLNSHLGQIPLTPFFFHFQLLLL